MKYRYLFALAATVTGTAFAAMPATLPEFKSSKQLADWRAEKAAEASVKSATDDHAFYTGKPYVDASGGYAFKFRSYNPELARWTSEDPSGFSDGANNSCYAPVPTSQLDYKGLLALSGNTNPNPESPADISYSGHTFRVTAWTATHIDATSFTFSGWTISNGGAHAGTLNLTQYAGRDSGSAVGAEINITSSGLGTPTGSYDWIQRVNTNIPGPYPNPTFDNYPPGWITPNNDPFYAGGKTTGNNPSFYDYSHRQYSDPYGAFDALINQTLTTVTWSGTLYLVNAHYDTKTATVYDGLQWGWTASMIE